MKAWELHGFGLQNLKLGNKAEPKPGMNEVLVRVSAVSLNYRDKLLVEGLYNRRIPFPMVQVADAVGEVVETGAGVTRFKVGDRVITNYATSWIASLAATSICIRLGTPSREHSPSISRSTKTASSRRPATLLMKRPRGYPAPDSPHGMP